MLKRPTKCMNQTVSWVRITATFKSLSERISSDHVEHGTQSVPKNQVSTVHTRSGISVCIASSQNSRKKRFHLSLSCCAFSKQGPSIHYVGKKRLRGQVGSEMVFCYQNCSDLLWEKIVLVIEKNFWNSKLKAENLQKILKSLDQFIQTVKGQNNFS